MASNEDFSPSGLDLYGGKDMCAQRADPQTPFNIVRLAAQKISTQLRGLRIRYKGALPEEIDVILSAAAEALDERDARIGELWKQLHP